MQRDCLNSAGLKRGRGLLQETRCHGLRRGGLWSCLASRPLPGDVGDEQKPPSSPPPASSQGCSSHEEGFRWWQGSGDGKLSKREEGREEEVVASQEKAGGLAGGFHGQLPTLLIGVVYFFP